MTVRTSTHRIIRNVFVQDAYHIGKTFHAHDSIQPSTNGIRGVQPSTVGMARRNDGGTQGMSSGKRPVRQSTAQGSFKANGKGAPGATFSAAELEKIKKDAFNQGVRAYEADRVRNANEAARQAMDSWVRERIDSRAVDDAGMRALLGGA
jgi:hypothetical protein